MILTNKHDSKRTMEPGTYYIGDPDYIYNSTEITEALKEGFPENLCDVTTHGDRFLKYNVNVSSKECKIVNGTDELVMPMRSGVVSVIPEYVLKKHNFNTAYVKTFTEPFTVKRVKKGELLVGNYKVVTA